MIQTPSYRKVHYGLRPAKQVERRMLVDALMLLGEAGFRVRDYKYLGMGSIHFVDFAMFHKYLGITKMLSVELDRIQERVEFNCPYRNAIELKVGVPISDQLSNLDETQHHLVWLDYDSILSKSMLSDISMAVSRMCPGSILLVTIDTEQPGAINPKQGEHLSLQEIREYYKVQAGPYLDDFDDDPSFHYDNIPRVVVTAISGAIRRGMRGFQKRSFLPLFNFVYKDGHRMATVGGMVVEAKEKGIIRKSRLNSTEYVRFDFTESPFLIDVPCLTRKEILYLESKMPPDADWVPENGLDPEDAAKFARIYRFFPMYAELF